MSTQTYPERSSSAVYPAQRGRPQQIKDAQGDQLAASYKQCLAKVDCS